LDRHLAGFTFTPPKIRSWFWRTGMIQSKLPI
jgi:hypothetical protein